MAKKLGEKIGGKSETTDRRVRISAKPAAIDLIYGPNDISNILKPLRDAGGLLFPYTPVIYDSATVQYDTYDPVHSNQPFAAFKSVAVKQIQISGPFTSMNESESLYSLAAIHFLRTITKMFFGVNGPSADLRGTPPPILLLNGYGTAIYHNVPVIVTGFQIELPQDIDYVQVQIPSPPGTVRQQSISIFGSQVSLGPNTGTATGSSGAATRDISAWVPTKFNISVELQVQNTPDRLRTQFDLNEFRKGALISKGGWV